MLSKSEQKLPSRAIRLSKVQKGCAEVDVEINYGHGWEDYPLDCERHVPPGDASSMTVSADQGFPGNPSAILLGGDKPNRDVLKTGLQNTSVCEKSAEMHRREN